MLREIPASESLSRVYIRNIHTFTLHVHVLLGVVRLMKERVERIELAARALKYAVVGEHRRHRAVEVIGQRVAVRRRDHRHDRRQLALSGRSRRRWIRENYRDERGQQIQQ
jgi:hypothetical protein